MLIDDFSKGLFWKHQPRRRQASNSNNSATAKNEYKQGTTAQGVP
jgi:hypothetical protein